MATSYELHTGDGATTVFTFSFPYLQKADVEVFVDDLLQSDGVDYSFLTNNSILFSTAPLVGESIRISRNSTKNGRAVDYKRASLTEEDLDTDSIQAFYALEEIKDTSDIAAQTAVVLAVADAEEAADIAATWAAEDEDVVVLGGEYSAKHYAAKAAASAAAAATFDPQNLYPVGSLYFNAVDGTNPATLLGFGTWSAFAAGQVAIGAGTHADTREEELSFSAGDIGGEFRHANTAAENGPHGHPFRTTPVNQNSAASDTSGGFLLNNGPDGNNGEWLGVPSSTNGRQIGGSGAGSPHNNMQPYITVYIWRRTA